MTEEAHTLFTPCADELVANNARYVEQSHDPSIDVAPARRLAIVACMDARMDMYQILGLDNGDAHIIRNAGGIVTDDAIRSLCLSQRALGTREIVLVHHTRCGVQNIDPVAFNAELEAEVGVKPTWSVESFEDPHADVRQSMQRIRLSPFVPHTDHVRGFVFDVVDGRLHEVV